MNKWVCKTCSWVDQIGGNLKDAEAHHESQPCEYIDMELQVLLHIDLVNHPPHYTNGTVECIDAIRAALTDDEWRGFLKGQVIKYTWRERLKGGATDLAKARWYMEKLNG